MTKQKQTDNAALEFLRSTGADVLEAAMVAKASMEAARGKVKRALKCIDAGAEALRQQEKTVTFEKAVAAALEARNERHIRTLYDFRYFMRRFMLRCKGLAKRRVRGITPQECAEYIETAFNTLRQRQKISAAMPSCSWRLVTGMPRCCARAMWTSGESGTRFGSGLREGEC